MELQEQFDNLKKEFEELKKEVRNKVKPFEDIKLYSQLKVGRLYANLPVYTAARADTPDHGEIYITSIAGARKINAYIKDTLNQAWSATLS